MIALFIAGGSGTRLYPLSREKNPKQLHHLVGDKSLLAQCVEKVLPVVKTENVWIVTNQTYAQKIVEQLPKVPKKQIIREPYALGTSLAVGLGLIHIAEKHPDEIVVVGWADSHIRKENEFREALRRAQIAARESEGVILAVPPHFPATEYGYIKLGKGLPNYEGVFKIIQFEEKPDAKRAAKFLEKNYYWNSGISVWRVSKLLDLIREHTPAHYEALQYVAEENNSSKKLKRMKEAFKNLDRTAIDRTIFEKAKRLVALPVDLDWCDIGSWDALYERQQKDAAGNVTYGAVVSINTGKCLVYSQEKLIATIGLSDLVIVETANVILIANRNDTKRLKELHLKVKEFGGEKYL